MKIKKTQIPSHELDVRLMMEKYLSLFMIVFFLCCKSNTLNAEGYSKIIRLNKDMNKIGEAKSCQGIGSCYNELISNLAMKNTVYAMIKPKKELCAPFLKSTNYSKSTDNKNGNYMVFATDEKCNWIANSEKGCTNMDDCMRGICEKMNFPKAAWAGIFDAVHKR